MTQVIESADAFLKARISDYPDFDMTDYPILVRELDAAQQLYFESLRCEPVVYSLNVPSDFTVDLTQIAPPAGCVFAEEDILGAAYGSRELRIFSPAEFHTRRCDGCTVCDHAVYLRVSQPQNGAKLKLFCRARPAHLTVSGSTCTGGFCVPEKHLPMLFCRMKESLARLTGDDADADRWAKAFNEWLELLRASAPGKESAPAAGGTL